MKERRVGFRAPRSPHAVAIFYLYATLWLALCVYLSGFSHSRDPYAINITTGALIAAVLLHFLATSARTLADVLLLLVAMTVLIAPTTVLLLHQTLSPQLYLAYLAANATIAAFVVDVYTERSSAIPRWLAGSQVAYLVILGLDSLYRMSKATYPVADLWLLTALHRIADVRLVLFLPIAIAWLTIAILRCRRDGSIDDVPVVWRSDINLFLSILQLPTRFAAAVVTLLAIILHRIGRDFLYEFRFHAQHLVKYLCTVAAVAVMFIGAEAFAPGLVSYIRTSTSFEKAIQSAGSILLIPAIGFLIFLFVPFITATLSKLWLPRLSFQRLLQRTYQLAVMAAAPCTVIGLLLWLGARWFDLQGFEDLGVVSIIVLVAVLIALLFNARWRSVRETPLSDESEDVSLTEAVDVDWRHGLPILIVGGVCVLAFGALHVQQLLAAEPDAQLPIGQKLQDLTISRDRWRYFWFDLPSGVDRLNITLTAPRGGADLYSNFAEKPTSTSYACHAEAGNSEKQISKRCLHIDPSAGRWWLGVNGLGRSEFSITASPTFRIEGNSGRGRVEIFANSGGATFRTLSDNKGSFKLTGLSEGTYVVEAKNPDCSFTPRSLTIKVGPSSSGIDFRANCSYIGLIENQLVSNQVAKGQWRYYLINVPSGASKLEVRLTGQGDADVYTRLGSKPTKEIRACASTGSSSNEFCSHVNPTPGDWWIGVFGFRNANYTVHAEITE